MQLFEVLRPVKFNTGRAVPRSHHAAWERQVLDLAGGLTVCGAVAGQWRDPKSGKVYREPMQPVRIACMPRLAKRIAELTKRHYDQKAVLCYSVSSNVTFT